VFDVQQDAHYKEVAPGSDLRAYANVFAKCKMPGTAKEKAIR